ncbi:MAG: aldehyde dehydrogenase family protein [Planctomycetota bacterium]
MHSWSSSHREQPESSAGIWNRMEHRPLDGFVLAITPFNFTLIAGSKPAHGAGDAGQHRAVETELHLDPVELSATWSSCSAAACPAAWSTSCPARARWSATCMEDRRLGGIHFTGSTGVFQTIWKTVGNNIQGYAQ